MPRSQRSSKDLQQSQNNVRAGHAAQGTARHAPPSPCVKIVNKCKKLLPQTLDRAFPMCYTIHMGHVVFDALRQRRAALPRSVMSCDRPREGFHGTTLLTEPVGSYFKIKLKARVEPCGYFDQHPDRSTLRCSCLRVVVPLTGGIFLFTQCTAEI